METPRHRDQMTLLIETAATALGDRDDYYVGGNMFVYFSEDQVKRNDFRGPDVFVVLGTTQRARKCWVAWGEGGKLPDVVIELTSSTTARVDRGEKLRLYERVWRTGEYYVYDPETEELEGWALDGTSGRYSRLEPDEHGDLPCRQLGLRLGVRPGLYHGQQERWLRWLDAAGNPAPTQAERARDEQRRADEMQRRADEMQRRVDHEQQRAEAAEARIRELEAKLRRS
jgi:Uma2 family endonuclease